MFSGMMLSQYTADMQIVEQKTLSAPAFIQSIPAAADQEDFVSMGMNSSLKTRQILDTAYGVLGIELMAAAQALDFREYTPGNGTRAAHRAVREHVEYLDIDRPLYRDHNAMRDAVNPEAGAFQLEEGVSKEAVYAFPSSNEGPPLAGTLSRICRGGPGGPLCVGGGFLVAERPAEGDRN